MRLSVGTTGIAMGLALVLVGAPVAPADEKPAAGPKARPSIIRGTSASIADFPWLAAIRYKGRRLAGSCTGTVVAPRVILTAAHCLLREGGGVRKAANFTAYTGTADLKRAAPSNIAGIRTALTFPDYDPGKNLGDVGLLVLSTPASAPALPIATPAEAALFAKGTPIAIAGWGVTRARSNRPPTVLRKAETTIQGVGYCKRQAARFLPVYSPANQLCATAPPRFEVGSCHGDSGGPAIARRSDGSPVQVGIVSAGEPDCDPRFPEVLARIDRASGWVAQWIAAVESGTPPPPVKVPKLVLLRLSIPEAKLFALFGLAADFGRRFLRGESHDIYACDRIEREKVKCRVFWFQGGNDYGGTVTIYWAFDEDGTLWNYRYRIWWVNDYCWFRSGHRQSCRVHFRRR